MTSGEKPCRPRWGPGAILPGGPVSRRGTSSAIPGRNEPRERRLQRRSAKREPGTLEDARAHALAGHQHLVRDAAPEREPQREHRGRQERGTVERTGERAREL